MTTRSACGTLVLAAFIVSLASFFVFNIFWLGVAALLVALAIGAFYFFLSLE